MYPQQDPETSSLELLSDHDASLVGSVSRNLWRLRSIYGQCRKSRAGSGDSGWWTRERNELYSRVLSPRRSKHSTKRSSAVSPTKSFSTAGISTNAKSAMMITSSLYKSVQSEFFTLDDGESKLEICPVQRDPAEWQPKFTLWNTLASKFDALKSVIHG